MQTGAKNMDSSIALLETDELLEIGYSLPEATLEHWDKIKKRFDDKTVQAFKKYGAIVAGGCFSPDMNGDIKDIDVFFPNYILGNRCYKEVTGMTDNSKRNKRVFLPGSVAAFEFILFKEVNKVQTLFDSFDISIAQVAYDFSDDRLHYTSVAAEDLTFSQFRLMTVNCTLGKQMQRVDRYRQKGYTIHESVWDVLKEASNKTDAELNTAFAEGYMSEPMPDPVLDFGEAVPQPAPPPVQRIVEHGRQNMRMDAAAAAGIWNAAGVPRNEDAVLRQVNIVFEDGVFRRAADNW